MKISRIFFFISIVFSLQCYSYEQNLLFEAIEKGNASKALDFFSQIDSISPEEARELITEIYDHYVAQLGSIILDNEEYKELLDQCAELNHSILKSHAISF